MDGTGSREGDALTPPGEYANSCVARERILQYNSGRYGTKMVLLRLNYAVELRYGVLVDIANQVAPARSTSPWAMSTSSGRAMSTHPRCGCWNTPPARPRPSILPVPRVYLVRDLARQLV